jgi:hypothetical protein
MRWILVLMATFLVGSSACAQDDLARQARALVMIAETANSICFSVSQSGRQNATSLSGESTAKLNDRRSRPTAVRKKVEPKRQGSAMILSSAG